METAIKKAIEGGWNKQHPAQCSWNQYEHTLLDPLFWKALGKQQGWKYHCGDCGWKKEKDDQHWYCEDCERMNIFNAGWAHHWHSFIDHIAEGKNIDDFFNNLLV